MFIDKREKLTTKSAAEFLNVADVTIHKYVKDGLLEPVYKNWKDDGTKLFFLEDIQKLAVELKRPDGLSISEIAKRLDVSNSYILQNIKRGKLIAEKHVYRGKQTYFIEPEIAEQFIKNIQLGKKHNPIELNGTEYFLYQKLYNMHDDSMIAFVIDIQNRRVLTNNDELLTLEEAIEKGYKISHRIKKGSYFTNKGTLKFEFMKPSMYESMFFDIVNWFYVHLTPSNMNINVIDNVVIVSVKAATIPVDTMYFQKEIQYLKKHLIEGNLNIRENKVLLCSDWASVKFYLREHEKEKLRKLAKEQSISLEHLCQNLIRKSLDNI